MDHILIIEKRMSWHEILSKVNNFAEFEILRLIDGHLYIATTYAEFSSNDHYVSFKNTYKLVAKTETLYFHKLMQIIEDASCHELSCFLIGDDDIRIVKNKKNL